MAEKHPLKEAAPAPAAAGANDQPKQDEPKKQ
jgi:hypothetical protein